MAPNDHQDALERAYAGRLNKTAEGFVEIPSALFVGQVDLKMNPLPSIDIYVRKNGKPELLRKADQPYSPLALNAYENILVEEKSVEAIRKYAESIILATGAGTGGATQPLTEKKMISLRKAAILMVEDLFEHPTPENIKKSKRAVGSFVYVLMRDPKAYLLLARLSSHDPYTLQHSVGTAVNAIILARKVGVSSEADLIDVGMAGLLHDIGKVKVSKEIINKKGPLDEAEWEQMRQHSSFGWEIVKDNPEISERAKKAILEHHEDKKGTGYPNRMQWEKVDLFSRIVCISDIFNALTTDRSYSQARDPFSAFALIRDKLFHKVDEELFKKLVLIYGGDLSGLS